MTNTQAQRCGHCGAWLLPTEAVHYPVRQGEVDSGNPMLGTVVDGKYRLLGILGRGGIGTVFKAMHIGSLMTVALKLLHPRFAERPEYRRALLPEARRAATVTHPRCARLLDVGEVEGGAAYLAMELVEGQTLDVLVRSGRLPPAHAVLVLIQVAEALTAIHGAGLVHCDLSPRNVMVVCRGGELHVKVLDFGIARSVRLAGITPKPGGEFDGFVNPAFAAPELLAGEEVDPRADLYSFGTLAWLLLTGSLPIDATDPRRTALSVAAGELRPWPPVKGVPRRLQQLVRRCLQHDREDRPPSAQAVLHRLHVICGARRPVIARTAVAAAALAVIATLAVVKDPARMFLQPWPDSGLELAEHAPPAAAAAQNLKSARLDTFGCHFGGFAADRLRLDVSRNGIVLGRWPLQPVVDAPGATLMLSTKQARWNEVVQSLLGWSREGPVDVSFVVPGAALLGTARVRLDDEPPQLEAHLEGVLPSGLNGTTELVWRSQDDVGVPAASVEVSFHDGRHWQATLPTASGTLRLGAELAAAVDSVAALGAGEVVVRVHDPAGNTTSSPAMTFAAADVAVPFVAEVSGPAGEPFVPCANQTAQLRIQLSAAEAGCSLQLVSAEGVRLPPIPLPAAGLSHKVEVPLVTGAGQLTSGRLQFCLVDAAGNRSERPFVVTLRNRELRMEFATDGASAKWVGRELVLTEAGATVTATFGALYRLRRASLELTTAEGTRDAGPALQVAGESSGVQLHFGKLPPGSHDLRLDLQEGDGEQGLRVPHTVTVRVLPEAIEVRVPAARSRFLPGVLAAGVLARRGEGLREGPGWRIDPTLLPYLRGTLLVGAELPVPVPLPPREQASDALLPEIVPGLGHNVLAVDLIDVLDRPARVLIGDQPAPRSALARIPAVVADFWWNEAAPLPIGEELLGEFGQPARLRLRFPLPFDEKDRAALRLGIADSEISAAKVEAAPNHESVVLFVLQFPIWSVAAQIADKRREDFAEQLVRSIEAKVATPAGPHKVTLRVRTTRSTLQPVTLAELGEISGPLAAIQLVPVLAPPGPFEEPVPESGESAPPRSMFRPQVAVSVRNFPDLLLQDREICCAEAQALAAQASSARASAAPQQFVYFDDPLGIERLRSENLLPVRVWSRAPEELLTGVSFFQAYALCRLLGFAVGKDPELFRLPLGCELELAAYGRATRSACYGAWATGGAVSMPRFLAAAQLLDRGETVTTAMSRAAGDVIPTGFGADFTGLDFGVREWVMDLPHLGGAEMLMREWLGDYSVHLERVTALAQGTAKPMPDAVGPWRTLAVVRGLALGELEGLLDSRGGRLDPASLRVVPETVPGVLRSEQLRRDGGDLLSLGSDPRLSRVGFRVAGTARLLARLRGRR